MIDSHIYSILNEAFTLYPKGDLQNVMTHEDEDLYTSDKLKKEFKELIAEQDIFSKHYEAINKLVDKDIIIPVICSKNILTMVSRRIFVPEANKLVLGFYNPQNKKIYMLLENHTSFIYWLKEDDMAKVLIHELQHAMASFYKEEFYRIHKDSLISYFKTFHNAQFKVELNDEDTWKIIMWIYENYEKTGDYSKDVLFNHAMLYRKIFMNYGEKDLSNEINSMIGIIKIYLNDFQIFMNLINNKNEKVIQLVVNLIRSYRSLGVMDQDNLSIQELIVPSEVICVECQHKPQDKHFMLINKYANMV